MKPAAQFIAGVAIGVAATAGIYAIAAATASRWAATFTADESTHHARMGQFQQDLKRDRPFERLAAGP